MMFFESAFEGKNHWWRYLVMFLVAFLVANIVGSIPLIIAIIVGAAKDPSILDADPENLADFSRFGIDPNLSLVYIVLPFMVGMLALALLMKPLHSRTFTSVINGRDRVRWSRVVFSFVVWTLLFGIYLVFILKVDPENYRLNNLSSSLIILAIVALIFIPFQSVFEEILFRDSELHSRTNWVPLL